MICGPDGVERGCRRRRGCADAVRAVLASKPDRADEREARIELGLGDADAGALRGGVAARRCGCPDAAAASRPARRPPPSRAPSGSPWARPAARRRVPGRLPEQRAQGVSRLLQPDLQLGDRGAGALEQRRRLGHVELRGGAVAEAGLGDLAAPPPGAATFSCGLLDEHLEGADHDVGARDLRGERDERRRRSRPPTRAGWRPPPPRRAGTCPRSPAPRPRRSRPDSPRSGGRGRRRWRRSR